MRMVQAALKTALKSHNFSLIAYKINWLLLWLTMYVSRWRHCFLMFKLALWPITRRVTGSTCCRPVQFNSVRLPWTRLSVAGPITQINEVILWIVCHTYARMLYYTRAICKQTPPVLRMQISRWCIPECFQLCLARAAENAMPQTMHAWPVAWSGSEHWTKISLILLHV